LNLLIDTHALLWWLGDHPQLRAPARAALESPGSVVWASAASAWEMTIKRAKGKLETPDDLVETLAASGVRSLPISVDHAVAAGALPRHHGDPFDRMLIAQAIAEGLTIVTRDRWFRTYGVPVIEA